MRPVLATFAYIECASAKKRAAPQAGAALPCAYFETVTVMGLLVVTPAGFRNSTVYS
jgi:hypothetical protein